MLLMVVFVVLMILWLFSGGWSIYQPASNNQPIGFFVGTIIPWICVAILGYTIFNGGGVTFPR